MTAPTPSHSHFPSAKIELNGTQAHGRGAYPLLAIATSYGQRSVRLLGASMITEWLPTEGIDVTVGTRNSLAGRPGLK